MSQIVNLDPKKFPVNIISKALLCLENGKRVRIPHHRKARLCTLIKIEVSHRYRLVTLDEGNTWELLSHEAYNRFFWH